MHADRVAVQKEAGISRRGFLQYVAGAISAFIAIVAGAPAIGYLASPLSAKQEAKWVNLGKAKDFASQTPQIVPFAVSRQDGWVEVNETRTCWVVPGEGGKFTVFNGRCTHLGCAFSWKAEGAHSGRFYCPCHDGLYDQEGRVIGGPPPRSLDRLEAKVENGELLVLYQDFRLGVEEKVPL